VLAEQDRQPELVGKLPDQADAPLRLLRRHPRRGLVENEELRFPAQRDGDLQDLLVPVGEQVAFDIPLLVQAHVPQDRVDLFRRHALHRRKDPEGLAFPRQDRDLDVFEDGKALENVDHLEGSRDPHPAEDVGGEAGDLPVLEQDPARIGRKVPRDEMEQRRLARAVGPDDRHDLPGAHSSSRR